MLVVRFFGRMTQGKEVRGFVAKFSDIKPDTYHLEARKKRSWGEGQDEIFPPERLNSVKIQRRRPEGVGSQETGPIELAFCTAEQP